jgi:serine/threonine-protein kinase
VCETIRHPHVVPVLAHGIDRSHDVPYFVMPLLDGEDMAKLLDRVGHLDPGVAGALFVQACDGLTAVHARGVVHRDVKPSNLFLVRDGDRTILKVTDFGLAKVYGDDLGTLALTATGRFMGTPHYVSPEQAVSAKHVDARGDVFSLAMSLYHALSGAPAFSYAKSFMKLVLEITSREAPPLEDTAPWLPPGLVRVVHGALLRDPAARCPSRRTVARAGERPGHRRGTASGGVGRAPAAGGGPGEVQSRADRTPTRMGRRASVLKRLNSVSNRQNRFLNLPTGLG